VVPAAGVEPATFRSGGERSNPLSYAGLNKIAGFKEMNQECPPFCPPFCIRFCTPRQYRAAFDCASLPWATLTPLTQVSVVYETNEPRLFSDVVVSTQHTKEVGRKQIEQYVTESLAPRALGNWFNPGIRFLVNPTGSFVQAGPSADCGVTGRKIIVDSYGGMAPRWRRIQRQRPIEGGSDSSLTLLKSNELTELFAYNNRCELHVLSKMRNK
jgi:S-adenosylmethionine synthetase, central domain/S-adenosylmethionine synthetase, C-terminal domain